MYVYIIMLLGMLSAFNGIYIWLLKSEVAELKRMRRTDVKRGIDEVGKLVEAHKKLFAIIIKWLNKLNSTPTDQTVSHEVAYEMMKMLLVDSKYGLLHHMVWYEFFQRVPRDLLEKVRVDADTNNEEFKIDA